MSNFPVGSKIIITNAEAGETYKNGEIYTVDYPEGPGVIVTVGDQTRYLASYEFEAYTEPRYIKIIRSSYPREYRVGDILEVHKRQDVCAGSIRVTNKEGGTSVPPRGDWEYYTEPVADTLPREIAFEGILKGDTIRAEYVANGVKITREGVVDKDRGYGWVNAESMHLTDNLWEGATYTLLERPEPPKPNPFAEAKVGSIATYGEEGIKHLKTGENAWSPISRKGTLSDYRNSDESMTNCGDLIQVTHNA